MFGRKRKRDEQIKEIFNQISQQREKFETDVAIVGERGARVYADIRETIKNADEVSKHVAVNIEEESKTIQSMESFSNDMKHALEEYDQLKARVEDQYTTATALVEENKHFTSPAKYLCEVSNTFKQNCKSYEKQLDFMTEYGKNMGVLALNAAIEAGRMGESAKTFVSAAEEIRQTAIAYEQVAATMKEEVEASYVKIIEMEDVIMHLVSLLKESNVGTAKLLKKCHETQKFVEKASMRDFSEEMVQFRDKVVAMRNLDEEISKTIERSKLQLSDIDEDLQKQKKGLSEIESDMLHVFDSAETSLQ